eukprot:SAG11_NODE_1695_length_4437_cov_2.932227_3_plen_100_part_00
MALITLQTKSWRRQPPWSWEPTQGGVHVSSQVVQESEASGEDEQAQDAPMGNIDDALFNTPNGRRLSSSPEVAATTKKHNLAGVHGSLSFAQDMDVTRY